MEIARISPVTGELNILDLPITQEHIDRWRGGELIQEVMPDLSAEQREFVISGCTPEDWEYLYGDMDQNIADETDHDEPEENPW